MTIRNRASFDRATTDWGPLGDALKPGTAIIDLDGVHDCGGRVLVIETKPYPFVWSAGNFGQLGLLHALAGSTDSKGRPFTVVIFYLETPGDIRTVAAAHMLDAGKPIEAEPEALNFDGLMWWLRGWSGPDARR